MLFKFKFAYVVAAIDKTPAFLARKALNDTIVYRQTSLFVHLQNALIAFSKFCFRSR